MLLPFQRLRILEPHLRRQVQSRDLVVGLNLVRGSQFQEIVEPVVRSQAADQVECFHQIAGHVFVGLRQDRGQRAGVQFVRGFGRQQKFLHLQE